MSEAEVGVPQVYIAIELAQPRKNEDGSVSPAEIEAVRSNMPPRYIDVKVVHPKDEVDEQGIYTGSESSYVDGNNRYEYEAKYAFKVYDAHHGQYLSHEPGKEQEWVIHYRESGNTHYCLVLGTADVIVAVERFKRSHPDAYVWSITQAELDEGDHHPQSYLEEFDEILVVGGAEVQRVHED